MTTHGLFTVQFIRNGDVITCFTEVRRAGNNQGMNLVQFWKSNEGGSGSVTDDTNWDSDHANNQPVIYIRLKSSNNYSITLNSVEWAYKGSTLTFPTLSRNTWQYNTDSAYAGVFQSKLDENDIPCLRIADNLISATSMGNAQITYSVSYKTLGSDSSIHGSLDVWLRLASSNAVQMFLSADHKELSINVPSTTVRVTIYEGGEEITDLTGYTLKWYDADGELTGRTGKEITVTRADIQGAEMIECKMFKTGSTSTPIAASAIDIWDVDDEYQIGRTPVEGYNYCSDGQNAMYDVHVLRNGIIFVPTSGSISYTWKVFNCAGVVTFDDGSGSRVTVTPAYCKVTFNDIEGNPVPDESTYGDATVEVTAQWSA